MRVLSLGAAVLGFVVLVWQIPLIGSAPTGEWLPFATIAVAVVLLAIVQVRHGG